MKRLLVVLSILLFLVNIVNADTYILYTNHDGTVEEETNAVFPILVNDTGDTVSNNPTTYIYGGYDNAATTQDLLNYHYRAGITFPTSVLPDDSVITGATVRAYLSNSYTALGTTSPELTDFYPLNDMSYVGSDYSRTNRNPLAANSTTATGWKTFVLTNLSTVTATANTTIMLDNSASVRQGQNLSAAWVSGATTGFRYRPKGYSSGAYAAYITIVSYVTPTANFSAITTTGVVGKGIAFHDETSNSSVTTWNWSFGDGVNSTEQHPIHAYTSPGTYPVTLSVSNPAGWSSETKADYVTITEGFAEFTATPTSGVLPLSVDFTNDTAPDYTNVSWFFGDEDYKGSWDYQNPEDYTNMFHEREEHQTVVLSDDSIVVMGGLDDKQFIELNDTWRSTDYGVTWTAMTEHAEWTNRSFFGAAALPDDSIVVIGGRHYLEDTGDASYPQDVWRSTDDGATWTQQTADCGFRAYRGKLISLQNGSLLYLGGYQSGYLDMVYTSNDQGVTWSLLTDAPGWAARSDFASFVNSTGAVYVIGGTISGDFEDDVWVSIDNGTSFTRLTSGGGWTRRAYHGGTALTNNTLMIHGGRDSSGNYRTDWWRSVNNGVTWTQGGAGNEFWSGLVTHSMVSTSNRSVFVIGGWAVSYPTNDVWFLGNDSNTFVNLNPREYFTEVYYNGLVTLQNGSVVMIGGTEGSKYSNATWTSNDKGVTWSNTTQNPQFSGRYGFSSGMLSDGSIVIVGGYGYSGTSGAYLKDVYRSTDGGINWVNMGGDGLPVKNLASLAISKYDVMIYSGGANATSSYTSDVYKSTDQGATWQRVNNSAWSGRYSHQTVALSDGSFVLAGGRTGTSTYSRGVYRSTDNGSIWVLVNSTNAWADRGAFSMVAMPDDTILLFGGANQTTYLEDIWMSKDKGYTWTEQVKYATWNQSFGWGYGGTTTLPDGSVLIAGGFGGYFTQAWDTVWRLPAIQTYGKNPSHTYTDGGLYNVAMTAFSGGVSGMFNTTVKSGYINATPVPIANFTANMSGGILPLTVQFNDTSVYAPTSWNWSFGDGNYSEEQNPNHTYQQLGIFSVNLTATNSWGSNTTPNDKWYVGVGTDIITVNPTKDAYFYRSAVDEPFATIISSAGNGVGVNSSSPYQIGLNSSSTTDQFISNSRYGSVLDTGQIGNTSALVYADYRINRSVLVTDLGSFSMSAVIFSPTNWLSGSMADYLKFSAYNISYPVDTQIGWNNYTILAGNLTTSINKTGYTGIGTKTNWEIEGVFGGAWASTKGAYTNAWSAGSATPPALTVVYVPLSVVDFTTTNNTAGLAPLNVQFQDLSDRYPTSWNWSFGDGNYSEEQNPNHTYVTKGNYTVNLTVTNYAGQNFTVKTDYIGVGEAVATDFMADTVLGVQPLTVTFTDLTTNEPFSWDWNFGDGSAHVYTQNPVHVYSGFGNFTVSLLTVNNWSSDTEIKTNYISVYEQISAQFEANPTAGLAPLDVQFTDLSNNATTWNWTFGDGNTSTEQNPNHTYVSKGNYTVNLTVTNLLTNDTESKVDYINVGEAVVVDFASDTTFGLEPLTVVFTDLTTNEPYLWNWSFGDGSYSEDQNPTHVYSAFGNYTVELIAANNWSSDIKTEIDYIYVVETLVAYYTSNVTFGHVPLVVQFTDQSNNATTWNWTFGDGNTSTERNPEFTYNIPGVYQVNLTATNMVMGSTSSRLYITAAVFNGSVYNGTPTPTPTPTTATPTPTPTSSVTTVRTTGTPQPEAISGIDPEVGETWITWTWTWNETNKTPLIYVDGEEITNATGNSITISGLDPRSDHTMELYVDEDNSLVTTSNVTTLPAVFDIIMYFIFSVVSTTVGLVATRDPKFKILFATVGLIISLYAINLAYSAWLLFPLLPAIYAGIVIVLTLYEMYQNEGLFRWS